MKRQETNEELAKELNELVDELEEYTDRKIIPYLGWYWRYIEEDDVNNLPLSLPDSEGEKFWWIDIPRKWGYPHYRCTKRETQLVLKKLIKLVHAWLDYIKTVNSIAEEGSKNE
ncbi:MAG: hypothetical protein ACTSXD_13530 [Candidatus Heimdallarchaeaceae archaeon]